MLKLDFVGKCSDKPYLSGVDKLIVGEKILQKEIGKLVLPYISRISINKLITERQKLALKHGACGTIKPSSTLTNL